MLATLAALGRHPLLRGLLCVLLPLLLATAGLADDRPGGRPAAGLAATATGGAPAPISADPLPHDRNARAAFFGEDPGGVLKPRTPRDASLQRPTHRPLVAGEDVRGPPGRWKEPPGAPPRPIDAWRPPAAPATGAGARGQRAPPAA